MANHKRRSILAAAGIGSVLAVGSMAGAGGVLAAAEFEAGLDGTTPDGYAIQLDETGRSLLVDGDGVPLHSEDDEHDDGEDEDHDEDGDDHEEDEDHEDEDGDEYEDDEDHEYVGEATALTDPDRLYGSDEIADLNDGSARLVLAFDASNEAFTGIVENVSSEPLAGVRIEVSLADGLDAIVSESIDLEVGEMAEVTLPTGGATVETFSARVEAAGSMATG